MAIAIQQNATAIGFGNTTYFGATGGTEPYVFSVLPGGVGGTIDPSSGLYTAPSGPIATANLDTIEVTDSLAATATTTILAGGALELFCEIIQNQMGLSNGRVYLWDQKINQPTDSGLYVAVSVMSCKPYGNNISYDPTTGLESNQVVNMMATVDVDIMSRGPEARDKKEFILMALNSLYSEQQQEANSFYISRLPIGSRFINLSNIDGAAIPYRYKISFAMQYAVTKNTSVPYYDTFSEPTVVVNN